MINLKKNYTICENLFINKTIQFIVVWEINYLIYCDMGNKQFNLLLNKDKSARILETG